MVLIFPINPIHILMKKNYKIKIIFKSLRIQNNIYHQNYYNHNNQNSDLNNHNHHSNY